MKIFTSFSRVAVALLITVSGTLQAAHAGFATTATTPSIMSPVHKNRFVLDQASLMAFQSASAVQQFQTLSVDNNTSGLLRDYMASLIYIPQAIALPSDEEALDEPWGETLISPFQYNNEAALTEKTEVALSAAGITSKVFNFLKPVQNAFISSPFGTRWGRAHQGIDMAAPNGTPIVSAEGGKVVYAGWKSGYGNFVAVDHGYGFVTHYGHCSKILVHNGQQVKKGQLIAKVGSTGRSTGPHLHFEVVSKGVHENPAKFIDHKLTVSKAEQ